MAVASQMKNDQAPSVFSMKSAAPTVWVEPDRRYSGSMEHDASPESMTELLAHAGIVVTDEGRARARRRLAEARARRDPAKIEALRQQFGLTSRPA